MTRNVPCPAIAVALTGVLAVGCASPPDWDESDPATMLYRECMFAQSGPYNTADAGAAMADPNSANTASFEASAERKREQRQQMECLQQARPPD